MSEATIPPEIKHQTLFGSPPTPVQRRIYSAFPEYKGISTSEYDVELMEALILLALTSAPVRERVFVFAPISYETWVLDQFSQAADKILTLCRSRPNAGALARGYGELFNRVAFTSRVKQFPSPPDRWLAYGFNHTDPVPEWLITSLLVR